MIKNKLSYLIVALISLFCFSLSVDAHATGQVLNYTYYRQTMGGQTIYCIDGSYHSLSEQAIKTTCSFSYIENSETVDQILGMFTTEHEVQAALRQVAYASGLSKPLKGDGAVAVNQNPQIAAKVGGLKLRVAGVTKFTVGRIVYNGKNYSVDVTVHTAIPAEVFVDGRSIGMKSDGETFQVTGTISGDCKTAERVLTARGTTPGTPGTPGQTIPGGTTPGTPGDTTTIINTTTGYYYVDCGIKGQNYIIPMSAVGSYTTTDVFTSQTPGTPGQTVPGNNVPGNPPGPGSTISGRQTISIPDPECNCKGESTLCLECNKFGVAKDTLDTANLLSCADNVAFQSYCGVSIEKTSARNKYCQVFCPEEIEYTLPGEVKSKAGRYFRLKQDWDIANVDKDGNDGNTGSNITVKGTRKCITNTIKTDDYIADVKSAQDNIITAYNLYESSKAKKYAIDNATSSNEAACVAGYDDDGEYDACLSTCSYTQYKSAKADYKSYETGKYDSEGKWTGGSPKNESYAAGTWTWISETDCPSDIVTTSSQPEAEEINNIATRVQELNDVVELFKKCASWSNNYCFEPVVNFSYDEPYTFMNGEVPAEKIDDLGSSEQFYSAISDPVEYVGTVTTPHNSTNSKYVDADTSGVRGKNYKVNAKIKYVKKTSTKQATFRESTKEVSTYYPYGTIKESKDCNERNCRKLGWVLPVALEHEDKSGIYEYEINFSNIGNSGDDECTNRINGEAGCSLGRVEAGGCETDYSCRNITTECPGCEIKCKCPDGRNADGGVCQEQDKICVWEYPPNCPTCKVSCVGCIWDNGDTTISFKEISLDDVYVDDSNIGSNWTQEDVSRIQDQGQNVYNRQPIYSFTLSPAVMGNIREYNRQSIEGTSSIPKGGYSNDTLRCTEGRICKSSFLREWLTSSGGLSSSDMKLPNN